MASLLKLKNNAIGRLNAEMTTSGVTLNLVPGQGSVFPAITTAGEHFPVTLIRASDGAREIVDVTARSSDILTVVRAREETVALAFAVGDRVEMRLTAGSLQTELDRIANLMTAKQDALGFMPYAASNPAGYVSASALSSALTGYLPAAAAANYLPKAGGAMTGPLVLADGTQGAPSLSFSGSGDSDTGLFHMGDGIIGIVCNNVLVGRFTPTGLEVIKITQTT